MRETKEQLTALIVDGLIEPSKSLYGAPILFVPKPNGRGLRLCTLIIELLMPPPLKIDQLPGTQKGHDAIVVFVDRLTKMVHIRPTTSDVSAEGFAYL
jgi:hypothetical protein